MRRAVEAAHPTTPLHLVTAWATEQRLVLAQRHARNRSEVSAARAILALLDLRGTCVTADALHGSRATAAAILAGKGDCALILKGNRGPLHDAARDRLANLDPGQAACTIETEHGRYEERCAWVCEVPGWAEKYNFPGLRAVARIDGLRRSTDAPDTATGCQIRYVALSRVLAPAEALRIVRSYWSIENDQHRLLDVAFREDDILTRNENAARNLALIRRMALNNLRRDPTKASIHTKMQMAGWDDDFFQRLIRHMR